MLEFVGHTIRGAKYLFHGRPPLAAANAGTSETRRLHSVTLATSIDVENLAQLSMD